MRDTRTAALDRFTERMFTDPLRQQSHPILPERRYRDGHPKPPSALLGMGGFGAPLGAESLLRPGEVPNAPRPVRSRTGDGFSNPDARRVWWLMERPPRRLW